VRIGGPVPWRADRWAAIAPRPECPGSVSECIAFYRFLGAFLCVFALRCATVCNLTFAANP
jgi:hypothetical protein